MFEEEKKHAFSLSSSQKNIWDLERAYPGTSINNISTTIRIQGRVDFTLLQKSIRSVLASDVTMRTQITLCDDHPLQYQVPFREEPFAVFDFSHTSQEGFHSWETAMTREAIPLLDGPLYQFSLFRLSENVGGVLVKLHHIISDGWSQMLICNRIGQAYLQLLSGQEPKLEEAPGYRLHMQEEEEYLASTAYQKDSLYWQSVLEQAGEPSVIKSVQSAAVSPVGRRKSYQLPQVVNHAVYSFCMQNRVAPFAVFYMALAVYFKRIGGADRFTIGVPIVNRTNYLFKQSTGMFVNTLPFFNQISDEWNLTQFNESLMEAWYELLRHQRFPFDHIVRLANEKMKRSGRLFHIALSYQDSKIFESRDASVHLSGRWHYSGYQSEQLCIHLSNMEDQRHYAVDYDYLAQFFSEKEIEQLHASLVNILLEMLHCPQKTINRLSVISTEERERVLYTFNRTACPIREGGLYDAFCHQVKEHPQRVAVICKGERMTYQSLLEQAGRIAGAIQTAVSGHNALVAILLPRDFTLFASLIGVMRAGCAYLLLSPEQPPRRIRELLAQSGAQALLTTEELCQQAGLYQPGIPVVEVEKLSAAPQGTPAVRAEAEDLAYVVYTSGSTGTPKGVEITQQNLLNLVQAMRPVYGKGAVLSLCNVGFDAFVLESAAALLNGRTVILPQEEELESPRKLAALITGYAVGFLAITPSRLAAFLKEPAFWAAMRSMESIVCGGEAFPSELLKRLRHATHARIYNQYGPSETTVAVSLKELSHSAAITAGSPMPNCKLYVLDRWMNPLPVGVYGHLYVGGLCVGKGYRNAPELTEQSFSENPFELEERIYRTGDVACWTADGELLLAGRLDQQVKLRGVRLEPQEVASCIASHPQVREAAALVRNANGQPMLTVYYCSDVPIPEVELLTFAASYLPRYLIPAAIQRVDAIPLTPNGKVDKARLPEPSVSAQELGGPEDDLTACILAVFRQVLGQPELRADSDYFLSGGNSLNAMEAIGAIEDAAGYTPRISDLYACRTARRLAQAAPQSPRRTHALATGLHPAPKLDRYPLTPIQQGIYVQSYLDADGLAYHMPGAFQLPDEPELARLTQAFHRLIREEPLFRTSFVQEPNGVFARVEPNAAFSLPVLEGADLEAVCRTFIAPFDLSKAPLLRAALWKSPEARWFLLIDCHHIIGDGMSTPLLLKRLDAYYKGQESEKQELSYLDYAYAVSQAKREENPHRQYWKQQLQLLPQPLELPTDFARPHSFDYQGGNYAYSFSEELSQACDRFCQQWNVSAYMLLLSAYGILLASLSGKEELLIGTPVSGRTKPSLQTICGPFLSMLPVRLVPKRELPVQRYLQQVKEAVNGMLDHPQCSMEEMISMLNLPRTTSQNALYQVAFSMRPFAVEDLTFAGAPVRYVPIPLGTAKSELFLEVAKERGCYQLYFEYASSLFTEETVSLYARCMERIVYSLTEDKARAIGELPCLSSLDRNRFWELPNHAYKPFWNLPIHRQAAIRAEEQPHETAVIHHGKVVSRRELETRACAVAANLTRAGVRAGDRVAFLLSRTPWLLAAMLGILKAGAAYVPLTASLPEKRIRSMLETSGAGYLLCDQTTEQQLPSGLSIPVVVADAAASDSGTASWEEPLVNGEELCYILFTSGSTGRPKGVMVGHRSVANLYSNMQELLAGVQGPILCTASPVFDIFLVESLFPLAMGNPVVLADEEEMLLPWKLAQLIRQTGAKCLQLAASRLQLCLSNESFCQAAAGLRLVMVGGEALTAALAERFRQVCGGRLINMYGPTETTVSVTMAEILPEKVINIGRPMHNCRVYCLDEQQRPVLPTACGELYIAGQCVAMGYASQPELTRQAFLPDPFFPGERMYRTGDLGRLRVDGTIDFLGRRDAQVKINGQRVELEEIVNLMQESGVAVQAAVLPCGKPDGSVELSAFYTCPTEGNRSSEQLAGYLRAYLPAYMVPAHFTWLPEMPVTPSGKIDLQALKKRLEQEAPPPTGKQPPEQAASVEAVLPAEKEVQSYAYIEKTTGNPEEMLADHLLELWGEVLGDQKLDKDRSFFAQGGTSLGALSVLSRYFNEQLELTMAQFYEHPTAREQAKLLSAGRLEAQKPDTALAETHQPEAFPRQVPAGSRLERQSMRTVLLTGATGFFGAHLARALLESGVQTILCSVRGGERERLMQVLSWYFGAGWIQRAQGSIQVLSGDLAQPRMGLSQESFEGLAGQVDGIYHCAADVRHYTADEEAFLRVNVEGTQTMIALACLAGVPLFHMSTASICGEYLLQEPQRRLTFTERDFHIGQNWRENSYIKSKFLAEARVYAAMEQKGLRAKVFRLGRIVGRASDGVFQRNPDTNAAYMLLKAISLMGCLPQSMARLPVDLTPVDWCSQAVLALQNGEDTAFHLMNPNPPALEKVAKAVIPQVRIVSEREFDDILKEKLRQETRQVLAPLLDYRNRAGKHPVTIFASGQETVRRLAELGFQEEIPEPDRLLWGIAGLLSQWNRKEETECGL